MYQKLIIFVCKSIGKFLVSLVMVQCGCGHTVWRKGYIWRLQNSSKRLQDASLKRLWYKTHRGYVELCPECAAAAITRCVGCGQDIYPGDPVASANVGGFYCVPNCVFPALMHGHLGADGRLQPLEIKGLPLHEAVTE